LGIGASEDGYMARDEAKHYDGLKLSAFRHCGVRVPPSALNFSRSGSVASLITNSETPPHTRLPAVSYRVLKSCCICLRSKTSRAVASSAASRATNGVPFASAVQIGMAVPLLV
jgi:hypothetical protein